MRLYPDPQGFQRWTDWGRALIETLRRPQEITAVQLPRYSVSALPSAAQDGLFIYVIDEFGGAVPAFSDGTDWRRVTDRQVVS